MPRVSAVVSGDFCCFKTAEIARNNDGYTGHE